MTSFCPRPPAPPLPGCFPGPEAGFVGVGGDWSSLRVSSSVTSAARSPVAGLPRQNTHSRALCVLCPLASWAQRCLACSRRINRERCLTGPSPCPGCCSAAVLRANLVVWRSEAPGRGLPGGSQMSPRREERGHGCLSTRRTVMAPRLSQAREVLGAGRPFLWPLPNRLLLCPLAAGDLLPHPCSESDPSSGPSVHQEKQGGPFSACGVDSPNTV